MNGSSSESSRALSRHLGFEFTPERLPELLEENGREEHSPLDFLKNVLTQERLACEERGAKTVLNFRGPALGRRLKSTTSLSRVA